MQGNRRELIEWSLDLPCYGKDVISVIGQMTDECDVRYDDSIQVDVNGSHDEGTARLVLRAQKKRDDHA
jgi:protein involved in sex pheromone biosynthesis